MKTTIFLSLALVLVTATLAPAATRLVPDEYATIQDAIDAAVDGDVVIIAPDTYTGSGNRDIDFGGKAITVRSTDPNDPNTVAVTIINCNGTLEEKHRAFYFHFGEDCNSVVCGFTITNGYADRGGAIYCISSSPTLTNCIFVNNTAQYWEDYVSSTGFEDPEPMVNDGNGVHIMIPPPLPEWRGQGGGIYCRTSNPTLTNCQFTDNFSYRNGGGMYNYYNSNPRLINCRFSGNFVNSGIGSGGGIENRSGSSPTLRNCTFSANSALYGGAMRNSSSSPSLFNCIFNGNSVGWSGGCMYNYRSNPTLTNCTFSGNSAYYGGVIFNTGSDATLSNCILWGNTATQGNEIHLDFYTDFMGGKYPSTINVDYSDVDGGAAGVYVDTDCTLNWGTGNIDTDPLFVELGYWVDVNDQNIVVEPNDPNAIWIDGDYHLRSGSPCIDAGDPDYIPQPDEKDLDGNPRIVRGQIDMGAYEFQGPFNWYVDADANGVNDGSSWTDAYNYLQDALMMAFAEDEIRVAQGVYRPDEFVLSDRPNQGREETFQLINGVSIKGGYAGFGEPDPNARDFELYETILSGDLADNDVDVNDPADLLDEPTRGENSYHVVTGSGTDETAIIDSFIITGGHSYYIPDSPGCQSGGAGMYNKSGSPMVLNCVFASNSHVEYGGGMHNYHDSSPTLINCSFNGNSASVGGGISNANNSNPKIINCTFSGNLAESSGGGICNVINSNPMLINCTFSGNSARAGDGMNNYNSSPTLTNCILWGNAGRDGMDESAQICGETPVVNYCCIQGWTGALGGTGNINADPLFLDATSGDYHLKSAGWRWHRQRKVWTWDEVTSLCIDAGNPGSSLENELLTIPYDPDNEFGINLRINMGAYGGTPEASMAPRGWALLSDLSNDGIVNFVDLALQVQDWLTTANEQPGDLNRDGAVNMIDFAILAKDWLKRKPFVVKITKPENGAEFYDYETIEIEADASDDDGEVVKVEFFANGNKIGEDNYGSDGWKTNWEGDHARGSYNLTTKATNDNGATTVSLAVAIRIGGGGPP